MSAEGTSLDPQEASVTDLVPPTLGIAPVGPLELSFPGVADLAGAALPVQIRQEALRAPQEFLRGSNDGFNVLVG